jgi:spoIIIJ-associated protein
MRDTRAVLEVIAPTIEEAITKGLDELGLPREDVDIEVLDEGSKGLFGLGSRQARIRLSIKSASSDAKVKEPSSLPEVGVTKNATAYNSTEVSPMAVEMPEVEADELEEEEAIAPSARGEPKGELEGEPEDVYILHVAEDTVSELLERMHVRADVSAQFGVADDLRSRVPVNVDITGQDLSILIGRQAETLNALQYIAGLMVSKEVGRSLTLVIDVQGYRKRREQQLRQLARRIADQAIKTGRRQVLEPMPANERRIIHIELRDHPQVTTESIGEDPRRKVTILLK